MIVYCSHIGWIKQSIIQTTIVLVLIVVVLCCRTEVFVLSYSVFDLAGVFLRRVDVDQLVASSLETELSAQTFLTIKGKAVTVADLTTIEVYRKVEMFVVSLRFPVAPLDIPNFQDTFLLAFLVAFPGNEPVLEAYTFLCYVCLFYVLFYHLDFESAAMECTVMFQEQIVSLTG